MLPIYRLIALPTICTVLALLPAAIHVIRYLCSQGAAGTRTRVPGDVGDASLETLNTARYSPSSLRGMTTIAENSANEALSGPKLWTTQG